MHSISPTENMPSLVTSAHHKFCKLIFCLCSSCTIFHEKFSWRYQSDQNEKNRVHIIEIVPLRLTPKCFSKASSISREPRIIQGVVPQTKRWYLPTCRINRRSLHLNAETCKIKQILRNWYQNDRIHNRRVRKKRKSTSSPLHGWTLNRMLQPRTHG